jgi:hypothetical protein
LNPKNNRHSGASRNLAEVSILNGIPACAAAAAILLDIFKLSAPKILRVFKCK